MLYSEQMKEICDKLGVDRSECKDGLYSTFLQAISDACDNAGGGGVAIKNQDKTITENGTYKADSGYTGLGTVSVNVPSSGIVPSGTIDITENGSYDVTNFATALVEIAASGGGGDGSIEGMVVRSGSFTPAQAVTTSYEIIVDDGNDSNSDRVLFVVLRADSSDARGISAIGFSRYEHKSNLYGQFGTYIGGAGVANAYNASYMSITAPSGTGNTITITCSSNAPLTSHKYIWVEFTIN